MFYRKIRLTDQGKQGLVCRNEIVITLTNNNNTSHLISPANKTIMQNGYLSKSLQRTQQTHVTTFGSQKQVEQAEISRQD